MAESTTGIENAVATINRRLNSNPGHPKSALAGFSNKLGVDKPLIGLEFSEDPTNPQHNWRVVSTSKDEYDFIARRNDPAHLVITPIGKDYLRKHPGFLKKIASGDLVEDWVSQTGTGSIAVHPAEFPETVVKYIRFGKTGMKVPAREVYYRVPLELDPDTKMPEIQTSTGTDIFYQTLFLKKVIEDNRLGIRLAEPVFATRDVLVSEYIAGPVFRDALQSIMNGNSKDEAMRLIGNFAEGVTAPLYNLFFDASHDYFKKYRGERKDAPLSRLLTLPDFVIRGGDRFWKMLLEGDEIPHVPGLTNWIVTGVDPQELQSLPNLSDEEQIEWLKEHLVLIDPFAGIAYLTPEEAARYDGLIISSEKEETFPAAVKPRFKGTQQVIEPPIYSRSETQEASPVYTQVANDATKPRGRSRVLEYMSSLRKNFLG